MTGCLVLGLALVAAYFSHRFDVVLVYATFRHEHVATAVALSVTILVAWIAVGYAVGSLAGLVSERSSRGTVALLGYAFAAAGLATLVFADALVLLGQLAYYYGPHGHDFNKSPLNRAWIGMDNAAEHFVTLTGCALTVLLLVTGTRALMPRRGVALRLRSARHEGSSTSSE